MDCESPLRWTKGNEREWPLTLSLILKIESENQNHMENYSK